MNSSMMDPSMNSSSSDPSMSSDNSTMMMAMSMMSMTFFTSASTPLYSPAWVPASAGAYAGTCIFLIVLSTVFRSLLAFKGWKEQAWLDEEFNRRYIVVAGKPTKAERISENSDSKRMVLTENGVEEEVVVVKKRSADVRPWRISVDPLRAVMDTIIAGVAYLLMVAVMTMNVGYFLSILGGTFLGSIAIGRYTIAFDHEH